MKKILKSKISIAAVALAALAAAAIICGIYVFTLARQAGTIPILAYHSVSETPWSADDYLFVRPAEMEEQLKYLADNGYDSVTFEDLENNGEFAKPVMLTFDDGYRDNYDALFPLLKKYNIKATIFVISGTVRDATAARDDGAGQDDGAMQNDADAPDRRYLSAAEIREMSESGLVSIQSHTAGHYDLTALDGAALESEMAESKRVIESITGKPVIALCYPNGSYNRTVRTAAALYYDYAVTLKSGKLIGGSDKLALKRRMVERGAGMDTFIKTLTGAL
jgi:peptidoglycan/xylan/chitin deacetylase (PgdA/CDA1 family)